MLHFYLFSCINALITKIVLNLQIYASIVEAQYNALKILTKTHFVTKFDK